ALQHQSNRVGKFHQAPKPCQSPAGAPTHTGLPLSSRNRNVSVRFTSSRARITSDASCLTFEPVTAISSPLLKLMPSSPHVHALFFDVMTVKADKRCSTFLLRQCGTRPRPPRSRREIGSARRASCRQGRRIRSEAYCLQVE